MDTPSAGKSDGAARSGGWPLVSAHAPSRSQFVDVRGLQYHVRTWGEPSARKLFLLHGWMDVSASFQFLVDALAQPWHVLAPDWRGFGLSATPHDGYWFQDYVGDLDALTRVLSPDQPVLIAGHSLGANVAMSFAGARPARVARLAALDGFGVPEETADRAPAKLAHWLDALAHPPGFAGYRDLDAVADRLCKSNPRLPRDKAIFVAAHWASVAADGRATLRADPKHKLPFPTTTRMDDMYVLWNAIEAPTLWVDGAQSHIAGWLAADRDPALEVARRFAHLRHGRRETIADAGHMLHHDQPAALARLLEAFFTA